MCVHKALLEEVGKHARLIDRLLRVMLLPSSAPPRTPGAIGAVPLALVAEGRSRQVKLSSGILPLRLAVCLCDLYLRLRPQNGDGALVSVVSVTASCLMPRPVEVQCSLHRRTCLRRFVVADMQCTAATSSGEMIAYSPFNAKTALTSFDTESRPVSVRTEQNPLGQSSSSLSVIQISLTVRATTTRASIPLF